MLATSCLFKKLALSLALLVVQCDTYLVLYFSAHLSPLCVSLNLYKRSFRLISAGSCHSDAVAIWDLPPSIMRHLGNTLRRYESHIFKHTSNCAEGSDKKSDSDSSNSCSNTSGSENKGSITPQPETTLCTPTLMGFAADSFANSSLTSVFGKSGSHQHPMNHQVHL